MADVPYTENLCINTQNRPMCSTGSFFRMLQEHHGYLPLCVIQKKFIGQTY